MSRLVKNAVSNLRLLTNASGQVLKGIATRRDGGAIVPGLSRARKVASDRDMPRDVDVVVVGGGYIGCCTALALAERGVRVALCEKGVIAGESSGRSLGLIEGQFLDATKVEIVARSKALWEGMNARVDGETGYRRTGMAGFFASEDFSGMAEFWLESVKGMPGIDARMLSAREANAMAEGATVSYTGGLYQGSDGGAEPELAAPAIAEGARKSGAVLLQKCAVRGVETAAGRISGVVTERGPIKCSSVVVAGGAWSPVFLRSLGIDLPQFMAFSSIARVAASSGPDIPFLEGTYGLVIRRTLDGAFDVCKARASAPVTPSLIGHIGSLGPAMEHLGSQIEPVWNFSTFMSQWRIPKRWALDAQSPFEKNRILAPETRHGLLAEVVADTAASFPQIGRSPVIDKWAGVLTSTPDNMPVISQVDAVPGLFVGSGFYFGLTMAPAAGEALADLVTGAKPVIDLGHYRLSRFSDGTDLVFRH